MKVITSVHLHQVIKDKYLFFDSDFLSELYESEEVFTSVLKLLNANPLLIDPLVRFEFLRSVFLPKQFNLKRKFIMQEIFIDPASHQEIFTKLQENALLLSQIYAHHGSGKGASFIDLLLGARIMFQYSVSLLITGNKKDYSSTIFDVEGIINIEKNDGDIKSYCILSFNNGRFQSRLKQLNSLVS